jgi:hypothetical protein
MPLLHFKPAQRQKPDRSPFRPSGLGAAMMMNLHTSFLHRGPIYQWYKEIIAIDFY